MVWVEFEFDNHEYEHNSNMFLFFILYTSDCTLNEWVNKLQKCIDIHEIVIKIFNQLNVKYLTMQAK